MMAFQLIKVQSSFESDNLTEPKEDSWHCQPDIALPLISVKLSDIRW